MPGIFAKARKNKAVQRLYHRYFKYYLENNYDELTLIFHMFRMKGESGIMLDVGSHYGESARPFLLLDWTVYGFEPDMSPGKIRSLDSLRETFDKFHVFDYAVSDEDGRDLSFYTSDESTGISSLIPFTESHRKSATVKTITIGTFAGDRSIESIGFLKIDTEGNDLKVLNGCRLKNIVPRVILCEFEDRKTEKIGYSYKDMGNILLENDYDVFMSEWYPIEDYGVEHTWRSIREYPCETADAASWGNFIAMKPEYSPIFKKILRRKFNLEI